MLLCFLPSLVFTSTDLEFVSVWLGTDMGLRWLLFLYIFFSYLGWFVNSLSYTGS